MRFPALTHSGSGRYALWMHPPRNLVVWSKAVGLRRVSVTCPCGWPQTTSDARCVVPTALGLPPIRHFCGCWWRAVSPNRRPSAPRCAASPREREPPNQFAPPHAAEGPRSRFLTSARLDTAAHRRRAPSTSTGPPTPPDFAVRPSPLPPSSLSVICSVEV